MPARVLIGRVARFKIVGNAASRDVQPEGSMRAGDYYVEVTPGHFALLAAYQGLKLQYPNMKESDLGERVQKLMESAKAEVEKQYFNRQKPFSSEERKELVDKLKKVKIDNPNLANNVNDEDLEKVGARLGDKLYGPPCPEELCNTGSYDAEDDPALLEKAKQTWNAITDAIGSLFGLHTENNNENNDYSVNLKEYAEAARFAYEPNDAELSNKYRSLTAKGWKAVNYYSDNNGFHATLLEKNLGNGKRQYIYTIRGTDDWIKDFKKDNLYIIKQKMPEQAATAEKYFVEKIMPMLGANDQITITGHSLGGVLAQILAAKHGLNAIAFDSPGMKEIINNHIPSAKIEGIKVINALPNAINSFGEHIVEPTWLNHEKMGVYYGTPGEFFLSWTLWQHSIDNINEGISENGEIKNLVSIPNNLESYKFFRENLICRQKNELGEYIVHGESVEQVANQYSIPVHRVEFISSYFNAEHDVEVRRFKIKEMK
jgi:hypothetical protein